MARVKPAVREVLAREGVVELIGEGQHIHPNVDEAVRSQIVSEGGPEAS